MGGPTRQLRVLDDGQSETLMKVAFASSDRKLVDQHFGSACSFVIYGVDAEQMIHRHYVEPAFQSWLQIFKPG